MVIIVDRLKNCSCSTWWQNGPACGDSGNPAQFRQWDEIYICA